MVVTEDDEELDSHRRSLYPIKRKIFDLTAICAFHKPPNIDFVPSREYREGVLAEDSSISSSRTSAEADEVQYAYVWSYY